MMDEEILYTPSDVQQEAHDCPAREILYGGTAGCGKTEWLRWDPIVTQLYGEHDRYLEAKAQGRDWKSVGWALHVRETYPMLLQTIERVRDFASKLDPGARWVSDAKMLEFSCGYKFQFGHLEHEDSWRNYDSNQYTHLALDEAVQTYKSQFDGLRARVRTSDPILRPKLRVCLASNPDAPVRGKWVKERFVDPAPEGRKMMEEKVTLFDGTTEVQKRIYIPAYLSDNPNKEFARDYEITLRTMPRHIMEARLFCKWDVIEGAFFAYSWIPSVHVVKPYTCPAHELPTCTVCNYRHGVPKHFPIFRSMDWGFKSACPVFWVAVNEDGDLIIIREVTFNFNVPERKRKDAQLVALAIKKIEQEMGLWDDIRGCSTITGPADYQICEQRGAQGPTIEETMAREGVYWVKSTKNRFAGTAEVLRRLLDIPTRPGAYPGIQVFDTCTNLIRTMPLMPIDPNDAEVPLENDEDHWYDCLMYACMYRAKSATKGARKDIDECDRNDLDRARAARGERKWGYGS